MPAACRQRGNTVTATKLVFTALQISRAAPQRWQQRGTALCDHSACIASTRQQLFACAFTQEARRLAHWLGG